MSATNKTHQPKSHIGEEIFMNTYNFHKTTANYDPVFKNEAIKQTLNPTERVVYGLFCGFMATANSKGTDVIFLSKERIMDEVAISDKTAKNAIKKLKDLGYITVAKRGSSNGKANEWFVKHVDQIEAEYQAAKESTTTAPEAPVSVSVEQPVPQQPVVEEVAQKAVESVTEVMPATEGVKHLARRNVPVQVIEQPVVVESSYSLEAILADRVYLTAAAKHKGCEEYDIKGSLAAGKMMFTNAYGPNSPFRITYLQGKAA